MTLNRAYILCISLKVLSSLHRTEGPLKCAEKEKKAYFSAISGKIRDVMYRQQRLCNASVIRFDGKKCTNSYGNGERAYFIVRRKQRSVDNMFAERKHSEISYG